MTTVARDSGGGDFRPCPEGTHVARCVQLIDLGTQYSEFYGTSKHKVILGWELPDVETEGESVQMVWCRYTLSLHKNAVLRKHLEAWRGRQFTGEELKGFDLKRVLDVPCLLSIAHRESQNNTYADVKAVMKTPNTTICPDRRSDIICFDIDEFDQSTFDTFSDNLKATIENSAERKAARGEYNTSDADQAAGVPDDEIPFGWLLPWAGLACLVPWERLA